MSKHSRPRARGRYHVCATLGKPLVIVLNKLDLAPPEAAARWAEALAAGVPGCRGVVPRAGDVESGVRAVKYRSGCCGGGFLAVRTRGGVWGLFEQARSGAAGGRCALGLVLSTWNALQRIWSILRQQIKASDCREGRVLQLRARRVDPGGAGRAARGLPRRRERSQAPAGGGGEAAARLRRPPERGQVQPRQRHRARRGIFGHVRERSCWHHVLSQRACVGPKKVHTETLSVRLLSLGAAARWAPRPSRRRCSLRSGGTSPSC